MYEWERHGGAVILMVENVKERPIQLARYEILFCALWLFLNNWHDENLLIDFIYKSWIINLKKWRISPFPALTEEWCQEYN